MRKPKRKRFAAILLSIAVAIFMLPFGFAAETAQAADSAIATDGIMLKVGGVEVTDANKNNILADVTGATGTASYDPATRTLTLNGATIPMRFLFDSNDGTLIRYGGIYAKLDDWNSDASLNIVLVGYNTINGHRPARKPRPVRHLERTGPEHFR